MNINKIGHDKAKLQKKEILNKNFKLRDSTL